MFVIKIFDFGTLSTDMTHAKYILCTWRASYMCSDYEITSYYTYHIKVYRIHQCFDILISDLVPGGKVGDIHIPPTSPDVTDL